MDWFDFDFDFDVRRPSFLSEPAADGAAFTEIVKIFQGESWIEDTVLSSHDWSAGNPCITSTLVDTPQCTYYSLHFIMYTLSPTKWINLTVQSTRGRVPALFIVASTSV